MSSAVVPVELGMVVPYDRLRIGDVKARLQEALALKQRSGQHGVMVDFHYRTIDQSDWCFARAIAVMENHEYVFHIIEGEGEGHFLNFPSRGFEFGACTIRTATRVDPSAYDPLASIQLTRFVIEQAHRTLDEQRRIDRQNATQIEEARDELREQKNALFIKQQEVQTELNAQRRELEDIEHRLRRDQEDLDLQREKLTEATEADQVAIKAEHARLENHVLRAREMEQSLQKRIAELEVSQRNLQRNKEELYSREASFAHKVQRFDAERRQFSLDRKEAPTSDLFERMERLIQPLVSRIDKLEKKKKKHTRVYDVDASTTTSDTSEDSEGVVTDEDDAASCTRANTRWTLREKSVPYEDKTTSPYACVTKTFPEVLNDWRRRLQLKPGSPTHHAQKIEQWLSRLETAHKLAAMNLSPQVKYLAIKNVRLLLEEGGRLQLLLSGTNALGFEAFSTQLASARARNRLKKGVYVSLPSIIQKIVSQEKFRPARTNKVRGRSQQRPDQASTNNGAKTANQKQ